jgi:hypothetical protein
MSSELSRQSARLPEDGRGLGRRAQYPEGERGPRPAERDETVHHHEPAAGAAEPAATSWHPTGRQMLATGRERAMG